MEDFAPLVPCSMVPICSVVCSETISMGVVGLYCVAIFDSSSGISWPRRLWYEIDELAVSVTFSKIGARLLSLYKENAILPLSFMFVL